MAATLDLRGLKCPYPVIKTENRLVKMAAGTLISVETTDPLSAIDIPHFCNENGHALVSQETLETGHRFVIRKRLD
ncbi:sulfurtransferase TusA family protein [Rhizobium sp. TH2]|nr:sulfurtransferase TusA family protein [Rhizobium sp. TH2]